MSFGYRDTGGVLQQAGVGAVVAWCCSLGLAIVMFDSPLVLSAAFAAAVLTARICGVTRELASSLVLSVPLALVVAMINPIASQQGLTVLVAGLDLPLFGTIDITREAIVYGLVTGLRIAAIFAVCAVYVATVDPDDVLRVMRRRSVRSAMTASLAVRLVPVLLRDGLRMAEARRCRPGRTPRTGAIVRAVFARSLDRASDAALALETRGFALARPSRTVSRGWRRADSAVVTAASLTAVVTIAARATGFAPFTDYPLTAIGMGAVDFAAAIAIAAVATVPLALARRTSRGEQ